MNKYYWIISWQSGQSIRRPSTAGNREVCRCCPRSPPAPGSPYSMRCLPNCAIPLTFRVCGVPWASSSTSFCWAAARCIGWWGGHWKESWIRMIWVCAWSSRCCWALGSPELQIRSCYYTVFIIIRLQKIQPFQIQSPLSHHSPMQLFSLRGLLMLYFIIACNFSISFHPNVKNILNLLEQVARIRLSFAFINWIENISLGCILA